MKKIITMFAISIFILLCVVGTYFFMLNSPSNSKEKIIFYVEEGDTYSTIGSKLKKENLIRNEIVYKIYIKLNKPSNLEYGSYLIPNNSNIKELIQIFEKGSVNLEETVNITFVEGKNMRYYINQITSSLSISEDEILDLLKDNVYLDELINKYWFITEDIKNKEIYYSLEGYLYPDTYEFFENASIKEVFSSLLDNMESKLEKYKEEILNNKKYNVHQMLTLASIIELEAGNASDRKGVSGVFYNRLNDGWSLGSDVTTYYAERLELWSRDLKQSELNKCNAYNTRNSCMAGKLPVSPICNASIESLEASFEPTKHNYYYFVADKNGKTYFNKTNSGHNSTIAELKRNDLWYQY